MSQQDGDRSTPPDHARTAGGTDEQGPGEDRPRVSELPVSRRDALAGVAGVGLLGSSTGGAGGSRVAQWGSDPDPTLCPEGNLEHWSRGRDAREYALYNLCGIELVAHDIITEFNGTGLGIDDDGILNFEGDDIDGRYLDWDVEDEDLDFTGHAEWSPELASEDFENGAPNDATGEFSVVGGGHNNAAIGDHSIVGGGGMLDGEDDPGIFASFGAETAVHEEQEDPGVGNVAHGNWSTISGGTANFTGEVPLDEFPSDPFSLASDGPDVLEEDPADGIGATVSGGFLNFGVGNVAAIGGGLYNLNGSLLGTIAGGAANFVGSVEEEPTPEDIGLSAPGATVGGGVLNHAGGSLATVSGGYENDATGDGATVGGGNDNTASGELSTIPGGSDNTAEGETSLAAGSEASAVHDGALVWGDSTSGTVSSQVPDEVRLQAGGGVAVQDGDVTIEDGNGLHADTVTDATNGNLSLSGSDDVELAGSDLDANSNAITDSEEDLTLSGSDDVELDGSDLVLNENDILAVDTIEVDNVAGTSPVTLQDEVDANGNDVSGAGTVEAGTLEADTTDTASLTVNEFRVYVQSDQPSDPDPGDVWIDNSEAIE